MGEDIHFKSAVYSKVENKYMTPCQACGDDSYSIIKPLFDGRSYDFFSIFGSHRGNYPEMQGLNYGIPDEIRKDMPTFAKYLDDSSFYGYCWITKANLEIELKAYIDKLKNPGMFLVDDEVDESIFTLPEWKDETTAMITTITDIIKYLSEMNYYKEDYGDLLDFDKTIFLIYFDC